MPEYIEREDTLRQMRNSKADEPPYGNWDIAHDCCIDIAKNIPTADVVEVKHSEWKYYNKDDTAVCKNCSYEHYLGTYHQYATNYCPNCGAKMDLKEGAEK